MKKDYLIMTIISVVYAVFAFTNLGSTVIPERNEPVEQTGSQIVFELEELSQVEKFKYYAGYCEGKFELLYSEDGIHYEKLDLNQDEAGVNSLEHEYSDMFKWHFYNVGQNARYLKIVLDDGYMEFREVAFTGVDDTVLPIRSAQLTIDGETTDASYMIDEQDQVPQSTSYMTDMYFDEVYHARTAYEYMEGIYPYEITHPPLGKSLITLGIQLFGFTPFGWRFMGALFGVLILPVLYIFAKRLFKKTKWAAVATILFAADFMHFSLTRIATIDSYSLFFILLMYLCMYEYTQHNFNKEKLSRTLLPLGLCGLAFGLGAATKWICLYAGVGLFVMFFYTVYRRAQEYRVAKAEGMEEIAGAFRRKLILTLLFCVGVFIVIPIIIYYLSYIPYFNAKEDFGLAGIWGNQQYMLNYHGNLKTDSPHPYQSSCYTWPFDLRPVFFFRGYYLPENMVSVIWCMASPLLAWGGLAAVLYLLGLRGKGKKFDAQGIPFIVVGALAQYLPWMIISREVFIYHYFATLPFVVFAIIYVLRYWEENYKWGKKATWIVVGVAILLFLAFYPALTGVPMSREWGNWSSGGSPCGPFKSQMKIKKKEIVQFIKFAICNQTAWLGDLGVFTLAYEVGGLHYILAKALSYTTGAFISYLMNRKITFRAKDRFLSKKLLKFIAVNCLSISLSLGSMYVFNDLLGLPVWAGYFLSILFSFSTNFIGNKFWVFRE